MNKYHYKLIWVRLSISFLGAFYINIGGHLNLISKALVSPMFYVAFTVSLLICYLLIWLIDWASILLNERFPWHSRRLRRALWQIILGILLPAIVHLLLIAAYFFISGRALWFWAFLKHDYLTVFLFIVLLNILPPGKLLNMRKKLNNKPSAERMTIKHNGVELDLNVTTDILYIYKENRKVKIVTVTSETYTETFTISSLAEKFANDGLWQVNPSALVSLHMLTGSAPGTKLKTLAPLFKAQFHDKISPADLQKLIVTRKFMGDFKKEMKKYRTA